VPCQDVVITKISADGRTLVYSTYLGGVGNDVGAAIAVDAVGNAYIAGITGSTDFPTYQPFQGRCAIDPEGTCRDGFVVKLNAHGSALSYSTYLGGVLEEGPEGIAVDGVGQAVVVGYTTSTNFPQRNPLPGAPRGANAFVTKFAADGRSLVFSTLIGGNRGDYARGLAVDAAGNSYLAGFTQSTDFPTKHAVQQQCAVDALGDCMDAFVAKLGADGRALVYSTYLGGGELDAAYGVAVDQNGQVVVTGNTASPTFPLRNALQRTKRGLFDAFVTKLTPTGNAFVYSTYLGGSEFEEAMAVAVDSTGTAYLAGMTSSTDFPVVNAVQPKNAGGACVIDGETFPCSDTFVTTLTPDGATLGFSTYLGGRGLEGDGLWIERAQGIAVDQQGNAYVAGYTTATDFPARHALQRQCAMDVGEPCEDGFVTRISTRVSTPQAYLPFIKR
jgi:hypothetical protein